jgi:hypothetical protein
VAAALTRLGKILGARESMPIVMPLFTEAVVLLRAQPQCTDRAWATTMAKATTELAHLLRIQCRHTEAIPMLQEAIQAQHMARPEPLDPRPAIALVEIYNDQGRFKLAENVGLAAEKMLNAALEFMKERTGEASAVGMYVSNGSALYSALATAYEGLGRPEECMRYTTLTISVGAYTGVAMPEAVGCYGRMARLGLLMERDTDDVEEFLLPVVKNYKDQLERAGLAVACQSFEKEVLPAMRQLVKVHRVRGNPAEAAALKQELDETRFWAPW